MWFPNEGLDNNMIKIMNILPFKNAVCLIQNSLNGINDLLRPFIIVLLYSLIIFILAIIIYKKKMKEN